MGDGPRGQRVARLEGLTRRWLAILASACVLGGSWSLAGAQSNDSPESAIRAALAKWTSAFNARDASHICDLFAPDLVYDYRGFPERDYATLCGLLHRSLTDPVKTFTYALDIKEIIVSGDIAVVRLVWTLKVASAGSKMAAGPSRRNWSRSARCVPARPAADNG